MAQPKRDHGGGLDAAAARYGGARADWIDLSTGINPVPYPVADIPDDAWTALPDATAQQALIRAAKSFWHVPDGAAILAAPGASSLIARIPALRPPGTVDIPAPTYNEHAAAFTAEGWQVSDQNPTARVVVHPNNPTGDWQDGETGGHDLQVIDESFCDVAPDRSLICRATTPGTLILKSFGKFWGLAGLRLGFAIGDPTLIDQLSQRLGPWPVAGPALILGRRALTDPDWANATRQRLTADAARLDTRMTGAGAQLAGGTSLFRLYRVDHAQHWQDRLAKAHIWTRIFPYSDNLIRLGLPAPDQWARIEAAL
ncbi:Threonine-phosphate decarboxylase [Thalassovita gelatinovora]|uniref:Aminotransferase n=1 Tax=Thalassovita gelatinovora TaxID=53501 RepID=A0A0P1FDQ9_THAGE|nr:threonine-phosphate decarboxylase [Thalassovita gelatinovora]QIZ81429.1 pyridoxal phosphate-dependent class II aminotransferase [Thalassovita gelatinovora]CUH66227.1 Threonine-phosphate decarboxylase [Thalassovita gelatinovora]SEQ22075.1 L-threonine O-3-phosphate decarboxylase [Thalassovita gelatinovora]